MMYASTLILSCANNLFPVKKKNKAMRASCAICMNFCGV
ncbi:hypothetical protein MADA3029_340038 [Vibrio nigripulchritudo MADA3029]|nr:hypothetical protein VIBNIMADA3020_1260038 [Vibrio nigripulchritudo MADA3020]CCN59092.1 hypothetical protein MADA3029_340038 [Vibrio nigripulchritudo MADA3029]